MGFLHCTELSCYYHRNAVTSNVVLVNERNNKLVLLMVSDLSKVIFLYFSVFSLLVDNVQVSCYRILNSLYSLGTSKSIYVER